MAWCWCFHVSTSTSEHRIGEHKSTMGVLAHMQRSAYVFNTTGVIARVLVKPHMDVQLLHTQRHSYKSSHGCNLTAGLLKVQPQSTKVHEHITAPDCAIRSAHAVPSLRQLHTVSSKPDVLLQQHKLLRLYDRCMCLYSPTHT